MRTHRDVVAALSADAVTAVRNVYCSVPNDAVRVAALVEISAAAAALARTIVKFRHLDPALIIPHVRDTTDLYAVLGRGRWLPTMTCHVPAQTTNPAVLNGLTVSPASVRRVRSAARPAGQPSLFDIAVGEG